MRQTHLRACRNKEKNPNKSLSALEGFQIRVSKDGKMRLEEENDRQKNYSCSDSPKVKFRRIMEPKNSDWRGLKRDD